MSIINDIEQLEMEDGYDAIGGMDPNQSVISGMSSLSKLSMKYQGMNGAG